MSESTAPESMSQQDWNNYKANWTPSKQDVDSLKEDPRPKGDQNTITADTVTDGTKPEEQAYRKAAEGRVTETFIRDGDTYRFANQPDLVAFTDHGGKLTTKYHDVTVANAMVTAAEARGWQTFYRSGSDEFKENLEYAATSLNNKRTVEIAADNQVESAENKAVSPPEKEEIDTRRLAAVAKLSDQYRVAGSRYYFKDTPQSQNVLAFKESDNAVSTSLNSERVTKSVMALAEAKGWETIKVSGHKEFRRQAWREGTVRGIEVEGYQPTEAELHAVSRLDNAREIGRQAINERVMGQENQELIQRQLNQRLDDIQRNGTLAPERQREEEMQL